MGALARLKGLKNRRKEQWRDKSEVDQTVKGEVSVLQIHDEIERKLLRIAAAEGTTSEA